MTKCIFVSDLHGKIEKYKKLMKYIVEVKPKIVFMGGDLLPSSTFIFSKSNESYQNFVKDFLIAEFSLLREKLGKDYPKVFLILD